MLVKPVKDLEGIKTEAVPSKIANAEDDGGVGVVEGLEIVGDSEGIELDVGELDDSI